MKTIPILIILLLSSMVLAENPCVTSRNGNIICIVDKPEEPIVPKLVVSPNNPEIGDLVYFGFQLTVDGYLDYIGEVPQVRMTIKDSYGRDVDYANIKGVDWAGLGCMVSLTKLQCSLNEVLHIGMVITEGIFSTGDYVAEVVVIHPNTFKPMSAVDDGSFTVVLGEQAIACPSTCGSWTGESCINSQIYRTRSCYTGEETYTGSNTCDSYIESNYLPTECCDNDDCYTPSTTSLSCDGNNIVRESITTVCTGWYSGCNYDILKTVVQTCPYGCMGGSNPTCNPKPITPTTLHTPTTGIQPTTTYKIPSTTHPPTSSTTSTIPQVSHGVCLDSQCIQAIGYGTSECHADKACGSLECIDKSQCGLGYVCNNNSCDLDILLLGGGLLGVVIIFLLLSKKKS